MILALFITALIVVASFGAYYRFIHLPEQERGQLEQRIKPLMDAGLTREKALEFDEAYIDWAPYNKTAIEYARHWVNYPVVSGAILETSGSLKYTVPSLDLIVPNIANKTFTQDTLIDFMVKHPFLVEDDGLNASDVQLIKYYNNLHVLTDTVISSIPIQNLRLDALSTLYPFIKNQTIPEEKASNFITKHKELALDGIDATDMELMKYYVHLPGIVDKVIEKVKSQDRFFALEELTPYISKPLTEEQAHQLIEKWYPDLFEACKKEKVPVVFGDPDEDFVSNYDEIFKQGKDPLFGVGNFTWTPTKVINGQVHEGSIFIRAKSLRGILPIKLHWVPINYTQFPLEVQLRAFPNETVREFDLIPVNENLIESTILIKDFKGGREYRAIASIRDKAGIENASLTTPYIREFENIAPLDDVLVGAYYYPWYSPRRHWEEGYKDTPLLGEYNSQEPIVISKHIDWATGHGIDAFIISWWGPHSWEDITLKNHILKNSLISDIKFAILYESWGRLKIDKETSTINFDDPQNVDTFLSDFNYISNYFSHSSYLNKNGSPIVFVYLSGTYRGNVGGVINELRESMKDKGHNIYLINDPNLWGDPYDPINFKAMKLYDAISTYCMFDIQERAENFEGKIDERYKIWSKAARDSGLDFIPVALPGFDNSRSILTRNPIQLDKTPERFKAQIEIMKKYLEDKMAFVTSFNEWHECTYIEPSKEDGELYLSVLKNNI